MSQLFEKPIIVLGCSRSGTTVVSRTLAEHPDTWSNYDETFSIFYRHFPKDPDRGDRVFHAADPEIAEAIRRQIFDDVRNRERFVHNPALQWLPKKLLQRPVARLYKRAPLRLVEKTPANSLRIPLLVSLFPDARFIFVVRRPEDVVSSLMEGWKMWSGSGSSGWEYQDWHYVAPPGWRDQVTRPLAEICAWQWLETNRIAMADLSQHCAGRVLHVRYEESVADPVETFERIREWCELRPSTYFDRLAARTADRPLTHGGSAPEYAKWKRLHRKDVESVRWIFQPMLKQLYPDGGPD